MSEDYTLRDAREIRGVVETAEQKMAGDEMPTAQGGFPAKYFSKKDDEKKLYLVRDYHKWLSDNNIDNLYVPTDADYEVVARKDAEKELLNFETFLTQMFDMTNPLHQNLVKELYPNYFERRLDVIREQLNVQEKIARLKLLGPQSREDIFFMYALANGDVVVPATPAYALDKEVFSEENYARGISNVKRWTQPTNFPKQIGTGSLFTKGEPDLVFDATAASASPGLTTMFGKTNAQVHAKRLTQLTGATSQVTPTKKSLNSAAAGTGYTTDFTKLSGFGMTPKKN